MLFRSAILVVAGAVFLGLEFFVPGGIVGSIGLGLLLAATIVTWDLFGPGPAVLLLVGEVVAVAAGAYWWFQKFPESRLGRTFATTATVEDETFRHSLDPLLGKSGEVVAPCHPAGIVEIDGRRHDVVSEGDYLPAGTAVRVVAVEGVRVVVRRDSTSP